MIHAERPASMWRVPTMLTVLSIVPLLAAAARLIEIAGGAEITPENARFLSAPIPAVLHLLSVTVYALLGAFQFPRALRRRNLKRHRAAGWLLVPCGLVAALTGLWMTLYYPWPVGDDLGVYFLRLTFGTAMVACLALAVLAVRQRNYAFHGAWMIRAYAIGLGAGTQVFTHLPWFIAGGTVETVPRFWLMGAGWVINVVAAEWIIRRKPPRRAPQLAMA